MDIDKHPNTIWIMAWADRMYAQFGNPDAMNDWCRKLAYFVGEEGHDYPSDYALKVAMDWESGIGNPLAAMEGL